LSAGGSFTVTKDTSKPIGRGTRIVLHMKDDMGDYLEDRKIKDLVKKHSEFIGFPIGLWVEKTTEKEVEVSDDDDDDDDDADDKKADDTEGDASKDGGPTDSLNDGKENSNEGNGDKDNVGNDKKTDDDNIVFITITFVRIFFTVI
jgi:molecular chaperone HtpG